MLRSSDLRPVTGTCLSCTRGLLAVQSLFFTSVSKRKNKIVWTFVCFILFHLVWVTGIFCRCRFIASESSIISFVLERPIYYFYKERDKHIWDSNTSSNVLDHTHTPLFLAYILNKDTFMVACASKYRRPHVSSRRDFPPLNV